MSPKESERISKAYVEERNRLLGYIRRRTSGRFDAEENMERRVR